LRCSGLFRAIVFLLSTVAAAQAGGSGEPQAATAAGLSDRVTETVVVTGTFSPTPLGDMDRSITLIETDTPLLYDHWVDYLQTDSSIDLRNRAPNGVQSDLSLRGSSFGETLILLDGFRMDDAQSGHHDLDLPLPTDSLERIEVLRGAGSTLYGSDAIGGAVNFITAHPTKSEVRLRAAVGNFGINQQGGSIAVARPRWDQQLSAARDFSVGFMPDRDYRSLTLLSSTGIKTRLRESLLLLAYGDKPYGANQFYGNFNAWERTKSWFVALKQDLGSKTDFDVAYRRHSDVFVLIRDHPEIYENNHITESWQGDLRRRAQLRRNTTLSYGGEGNHDSIASNNLGIHDRGRGAAYLDLDVRELRRFSLSAGARTEVFGRKNAQFSPTLGAGLWLKRGFRARASVGRAYRLPSYTDLYYHDPATSGNPDLKPESAWSYEGGLQWFPSDKIEAQATVFENRERNVIDYVKFFATDINHAANIRTLNFTGVESSLKAHLLANHTLDASYTWISGTQQALSQFASSKYVFNYPINNLVVGWQAQLPRDILARTRFGIVERFGRDTYGMWDLDVARHFGNVGARLSLSNLTDAQYQEILGVNAPGRSIVFGLEYVFRSAH